MLAACAVVVSACAGPSVLVAGEAVRNPEPPPPEIHLTVLAGDDFTPVNAVVAGSDEELASDDTGSVTVVWRDEPLELSITAPGFRPVAQTIATLPADLAMDVVMQPVVLNGTVITSDGRPLPATTVQLANATTTTNSDGRFSIIRAEPGDLSLSRPAWEPATVPWDGSEEVVELAMEPRMVRALRVGGDKAGDTTTWNQLLDLAGGSGVNAFVIDTKDEGGTVFHDTEVDLAHEIGAVTVFYDLDQIIADMDEAGLYKITRIVTFQDNFLAKANPDIAARDATTGRPWRNNKGLRWLDPTDRDSWTYVLDLAREACRRGFDEIQFDYIRFPSDGPIRTLEFDELTADNYYGDAAQEKRLDTIAAFLTQAHSILNPMGCAVAADIFAITLESPSDEGIGQSPRVLSSAVDVLSPMIYTYTYGPGWKGWDDPNEHAEELVTAALDAGIPRLRGFSIYRPWLQRAFIDADEILAVQGVAEARDMGWMLWSANTQFDLSHLPPP